MYTSLFSNFVLNIRRVGAFPDPGTQFGGTHSSYPCVLGAPFSPSVSGIHFGRV